MGDSFLITDPRALWFLLILPVIVFLYMVRSRYRRHRVSSTMLWRSVRQDLEARQRLRLPPVSLLMLLQLLAVAIGASALAKPAIPAENRTHLVLVMDVSASMQAIDVTPSRFDVAIERARRAVQRMEPGDQISLVEMGSSPILRASGTERSELQAVLNHLRPRTTAPDAGAALKLAESLIMETGGVGQVLLLSDGVFGPAFRAPDLGVPVIFNPIGVGGDNQGIVTVDVRPDLDGSGRWSAFARIANYADQPAPLVATATADGLTLDTRPLLLAPRGSSELSFGLPIGTRTFAIALDTRDSLSGDNRAELRVDMPLPRSVLVVSVDAEPIQRALQTLPGLKVATTTPEDYQGAAEADLVVLDHFIPATLPDTDLLIMNPPADAPGFVTEPAEGEAPILRSRRDSSIIESVDLQSLRLGQMVRLETPNWAHAVVEGPGGPLILQGDLSGRRVVVFEFDWLLYDLPSMQAFPLLLSNAVAELNPMALPASVYPGDSVLLRPVADGTEVTVELPDGSRRRLSLDQGAQSFGETEQVGRYTVQWRGGMLGEIAGSFNVNMVSESQSDMAPRSYAFGQGRAARGLSTTVPGRQMWPALALLLLGVLSVEWLYFARRN